MVINILKNRDNLLVFNPEEALEEMKKENIKEVYIQPLHIIAGHEYEKLLNQVEEFKDRNRDFIIKVGKPLLYDEDDYIRVIDSLEDDIPSKEKGLAFMGHGTDHLVDSSYKKLEKGFRDKGYKNIFVGTVEGERGLTYIIDEMKNEGLREIKLCPFMLVAGDHVINDMASDDEDSWKSQLEKEGFSVTVIVKGLGQNESIQDIYLDHLKGIIDS
jgi:sirohydrochlorin cobaltochelatase